MRKVFVSAVCGGVIGACASSFDAAVVATIAACVLIINQAIN